MDPRQVDCRVLTVVDSLSTFRRDVHGVQRIPFIPPDRFLAGPRHILVSGDVPRARKALQDILQGLRADQARNRESRKTRTIREARARC